MGRPVTVAFDVGVAEVFGYLTDPLNRPEWQSSLRRVEVLDPGPAHEGQRWIDVTVPGLRPRMSTTVLEPDRRWVEHGTWRGVELDGELVFEAAGGGCRVTVTARFAGARPWRGVLPALGLAAGVAVGADLRRAAALLSARRAASGGGK